MPDEVEPAAAEVRVVIDRLQAELGLDFGDLDETRSPCSGPGLTDKERVDFHSRLQPDEPVDTAPLLEASAAVISGAGWSVDRETTRRGEFVFGQRGVASIEVGVLADGAIVTLTATSGCHDPA